MKLLQKIVIPAALNGPFFWLFTTRLVLTFLMTTIAGIAFASSYVALAVLTEVFAMVMLATVVKRMLTAVGATNPSPK